MQALTPADMAATQAAVSASFSLPAWLRGGQDADSPVLRALRDALPRAELPKNILEVDEAAFEAAFDVQEREARRLNVVATCLASGFEGDDFFRQPNPKAGLYTPNYCWHLALNTRLYGREGDRLRFALNLNLLHPRTTDPTEQTP